MNTNFLLTIVPYTKVWSTQSVIIMTLSNIICIAIGRYAIQIRGLGPAIPILGLKGFGLPELLATTSLGHIVGAGAIIGLTTVGAFN
uniref:Photosystem I reaction center subunit PsaK n=1 Tax=Eucheuma denticulatum TaxID=305493 RepID=A0A8E7UES6_9FLOR|nr:photosystem I subunit X [Eucheuma denticulatum]